MKKRILPALLALCMVMSLLPVGFAEDVTYACNALPTTKTEEVTNRTTDYKVDNKTVEVTTTVTTEYDIPTGHTCANPKGCTCYTEGETDEGTPSAVVVGGTEEKPTYTNTVTDTVKLTYAMCDACKANAACNPCSGDKDCTSSIHNAGCPAACGKGGCTLSKDHENPAKHNGTSCAKDENCNAATHEVGCPLLDACKDHESDETNPGVASCGLPYGHEGKHDVKTCTKDDRCPVDTGHDKDCPLRCTKLDTVKELGSDGKPTGEATADGTICTRSKGHSGVCNNTKCVGTADCGAATHVKSKAEVKDKDGNVTTEAVKGCVNEKSVCGVGGCEKTAGHEGIHANTECLGVNGTAKTCNTETVEAAGNKHIAGCELYDCGKCNHTHANFKPTTECTSTAGCTFCNAWNAFVAKQNAAVAEYAKYQQWVKDNEAYTEAVKKDANQTAVPNPGKWTGTDYSDTEKHPDPGAAAVACTCKDCAPNPAVGALTNAEGETVDNPVAPAEDEKPTKVEEFKDADKMTAEEKDAVQVMLDNKWMEGTGEEFDTRGAANTNVVLTVIARMTGETITGATWADDAKAWAEENDLTEGIEITKADMARKDIILMLWRLAGKPGSEQELEFTDVDELEGDYLTALKWAVETGIVKGNGDGTVSPDGTLKRSELAIMVARYAANVK